MSIFSKILQAARVIFEVYFPTDVDLISPEAREILSNPEDKKKYLDAINRMRDGNEEKVTIELHNGKNLTLVS